MFGWYNRKGKKMPMSEVDWDIEHRRVALDRLPNGYTVSTVHLALDHNWGAGPSLIYETMVFDERLPELDWNEPGPSNRTDFECVRYATLQEAMAGHTRLVAKWSAARE